MMRELKRVLDIAGSLVGMTIFSPILIICSILIVIFLGSPIFFFQERPGRRGVPFLLVKFRTMKRICDKSGQLRPDEERLTRLGKILRRFSLDELPELYNVLRGDMSLIGPRPLLMQYLGRYTSEQMRRHEMRPGLTGWAQIHGRNAISWEKKFKYDVWYIDHWSLWLDLKIFFITFWKIVMGEGVNQKGRATMEEFMGSDKVNRDLQL